MSSAADVKLPPAELQALRDAVKRLGAQAAAAEALGVSPGVVNNALKERYFGSVEALAQRIRGAFMDETVRCPVMGDLSAKHCLDYQTRPVAFTNPLRVRLYRACKTCPNRKAAGKGAAE